MPILAGAFRKYDDAYKASHSGADMTGAICFGKRQRGYALIFQIHKGNEQRAQIDLIITLHSGPSGTNEP